jgi:hypothetical protein
MEEIIHNSNGIFTSTEASKAKETDPIIAMVFSHTSIHNSNICNVPKKMLTKETDPIIAMVFSYSNIPIILLCTFIRHMPDSIH